MSGIEGVESYFGLEDLTVWNDADRLRFTKNCIQTNKPRNLKSYTE